MMWAHLFLLDLGAAKTIEHRVSELIEQAGNPRLVSYANLYQVYLLDALGQTAAARDLLERILEATSEVDEALYVPRMSALVRAAENAYRDGAPERAAELAAEVVEKLAADQRIVQNNVRGRGWLLLIRARLALGELAAAAREAASMDAWSAAGVSRSPRIYAHLAAAELAAAEDRDAAAGAAYALALAQADDSQVPLYLLHVAASYVPWLLDPARRDPRRVEQALNVAARLADVVDRYYEAALLQLYVYHAAGPPSAWRGALSRAQALAGEREIPPELLSAP